MSDSNLTTIRSGTAHIKSEEIRAHSSVSKCVIVCVTIIVSLLVICLGVSIVIAPDAAKAYPAMVLPIISAVLTGGGIHFLQKKTGQ